MRRLTQVCLITAFICSMSCSTCLAKGVKIALKDNTEKFTPIDKIGKITIVDGAIVVSSSSGSSDSTPISEILNITLGESSGIDLPASDDSHLSVSPNPCSDFVFVTGIPDASRISVFSIDGRLVKSAIVSSGEQVSLENITPGVYIVKAANESLKLMKK